MQVLWEDPQKNKGLVVYTFGKGYRWDLLHERAIWDGSEKRASLGYKELMYEKRYRWDPLHEHAIWDAWEKRASLRYKDLMYEPSSPSDGEAAAASHRFRQYLLRLDSIPTMFHLFPLTDNLDIPQPSTSPPSSSSHLHLCSTLILMCFVLWYIFASYIIWFCISHT
ncbi:hypothetical protein M9H77_29848 [Catharanthus roseus]|uniref:Uncharacterized protein n=1 Tax=Catharanthus roseus TaxID=4058 RepID=A0ACB9ZVX8_CATRO|nr:hypothetical protein M9H77_29848 [Catharanthus roseus]